MFLLTLFYQELPYCLEYLYILSYLLVVGLNKLAETLAQARTQLSAPVIPPPEEQRDFSILQEVVNSLDKVSLPPLVQAPGVT